METDNHCIFCRIIKGELPCQKVYEDDHCLAFRDIKPVMQTHVLLIPKKHIATLLHLSVQDAESMGQLMVAVPKVAEKLGLQAGFRTVINTGKHGGQEVYHIHLHLLADEQPLRDLGFRQ